MKNLNTKSEFSVENFNRACAEFLGLKLGWWIHQEKPLTEDKKQWCDIEGKTFLGSKVYYTHELKFDSNWEWIMMVWEKMYITYANKSFKEHCEFQSRPEILKLKEIGLCCADKEIAVESIWEFLNGNDSSESKN